MYKLLISKLLRNLLYVTICCMISTSFCQEKNIEKRNQAKELVKDLGANSYKQRKKAIAALIELGYFARAEVKKVLNSKDPEVKENAKLVWDKIRWAITEKNPEVVNDFISKYHKGETKINDWTALVEKCGVDTLDVMIELSTINTPKVNEGAKDGEEDPFEAGNNPFESRDRNFGFSTMLPIIIYNTDIDELNTAVQTLEDKSKNRFQAILTSTLAHSGPYIQSRLLNMSSLILGQEKTWEFYTQCDVTSHYIRKKLSEPLLDYVKKNYKNFNAESKIRALLALISKNHITIEQLCSELPVNEFHQCSNKTQKAFYNLLENRLSKESRKKLLENGNEPWHKYQLMKLEKLPERAKMVEIFSEVFSKGGDIVEFIQENFPMGSEQAIPFHLIASEMDNKNNDWFLYSTSTILTNHFHRIGDYQKAIKYLRLFNDENERQQDTNEAFYADQDRLIKAETKEILEKCQPIARTAPLKALDLFEKAEKLNPKILIIKIQKLDTLVRLKQYAKAKEYLKSIYADVPDNIIEIRDLVYLAWELDAKDIATKLVAKLNLAEENYGNITLASSNYEYFLNMDKTKELQQKIGLNSFAETRDLFYKKNYEPIPALCQKPDEGDFQYIWGVISLKISKGEKAASKYFSKRIFDDYWPEMLGLSLIGKISPEEIIEEAKSVLNLTERQGRLTEAYYYAGCYCMSLGENEKAKEYFKKSLAISFYEYYEFVSSKVMLQKVN